MIEPGARLGAALVLALLMVLGAALLTTALLHVAGRELIVAGSATHVARARAGAETAARAAAADWWTADVIDLQPAASRTLETAQPTAGEPESSVRIQRLDGGRFLIRVRARAGAGASARAGLLVRVLEPAEVWAGFGAALAAAGPVGLGPDALISALDADPPPPWTGAICEGAAGASGSLFGHSPRPALVVAQREHALEEAGAELRGEPGLLVDAGRVELAAGGLGALELERVPAVSDRSESGSLSLGPAYLGGRCAIEAAGNWGDPLQPEGPCGDHVPLVHSDGDLEVVNGTGQAVLVVAGDLRIGSAVRIYGPVIVGGAIRVDAGAAVYGAVRALGAGPHRVDGRIVLSDCALYRAFRRARGVNRAFAAGSRQWVPVF